MQLLGNMGGYVSMGKILLFHNGIAAKPPKMYREFMENSVEKMVQELCVENPNGRRNTGTYLMTDTLRHIIDADELIPRFYEFDEHVDTVVTNVLHRIGADIKIDFPYWENVLEHADRVVPLSMGFAFSDGEIAPVSKELDRFLKMLAERCELGVRTIYDAEALNGVGIKNVKIIGCPSLFFHMNREFQVDDSCYDLHQINFNFTTDFANLGICQRRAVEVHWPFILYFKQLHEAGKYKIDLTMQKPPFAEINDIHAILLSYAEVHKFYSDCGRYFYGVEDWIKGIKENDDFSIGSRFHGNIAAVLAGIPALPVNVDKRMKGMNDFFKIPSIDMEEFDAEKPLIYYREMADYSEFNKNYKIVYDNFVDYCNKNGVRLKKETCGKDKKQNDPYISNCGCL